MCCGAVSPHVASLVDSEDMFNSVPVQVLSCPSAVLSSLAPPTTHALCFALPFLPNERPHFLLVAPSPPDVPAKGVVGVMGVFGPVMTGAWVETVAVAVAGTACLWWPFGVATSSSSTAPLVARLRKIGGGVALDRSSSEVLFRCIHDGMPIGPDPVLAPDVASVALPGALSGAGPGAALGVDEPRDLRKSLFRPSPRFCCAEFGG